MNQLSLPGTRVLIVEDNYVVADALKFLLEGYQCQVTAMAPNLEQAFAAVAAAPIDVAILDINLNGTSVVPLAEYLGEKGMSFVFVSGYGDVELLPEHLRGRPRLDKPVEGERLMQTLSHLVSAGRDA